MGTAPIDIDRPRHPATTAQDAQRLVDSILVEIAQSFHARFVGQPLQTGNHLLDMPPPKLSASDMLDVPGESCSYARSCRVGIGIDQPSNFSFDSDGDLPQHLPCDFLVGNALAVGKFQVGSSWNDRPVSAILVLI